MKTSPKRDMEATRTVISFMAMAALENTLEKGQKNGDATKVITSAEIGTIDGQVPTIDTDVKFYEVSLDVDKNEKRRELQKAIIREQNAEKDLSEVRE